MANKVIFKKNNLGSGQGWHKDNIARQLKFMIYLNDVNQDNGPFQYLRATNRVLSKIRIRIKNNLEFDRRWYSENEINNILLKNNFELKTFSFKAGTLILFDGNGIHRGSPILKNSRYSLTNYYYFNVKGGHDFPIINKS